MAAAVAARSVFRSRSLHNAAASLASNSKASRLAVRLPTLRPSSPRFLRSPMETSFCVESLLPMHSATASALMTSMLCVSRRGCGCLSEGQDETR